jgi:type III secretion protein L
MAKIIKGESGSAAESPSRERAPGGTSRKLIDAEVYDATRQARQIVSEAEEEAVQILAKAQAERGQIQEEAVEAGRQEGLAKVSELLAKAGAIRDRKMAELESQVVHLAIKVAEKILGREILLNDEAVVDIAAQALQMARQQKEISLRVHPEDAESIRQNQRRLIDLLSRAKHIEIREDETVSRGSVLLETEVGIIDARIETQLEMLERVLSEAE